MTDKEEFTFLIKVDYYIAGAFKQTGYHTINAENFTEVIEKIEDYYGDEIERIEVDCVEYNCGTIDKKTYRNLLVCPMGSNDDNDDNDNDDKDN